MWIASIVLAHESCGGGAAVRKRWTAMEWKRADAGVWSDIMMLEHESAPMQADDPPQQTKANHTVHGTFSWGVPVISTEIWFFFSGKPFPQKVLHINSEKGNRPVRLAYQPPASSTCLSEQTSHQQLANSTFLSEQISIRLNILHILNMLSVKGRLCYTLYW
jgi:hypothetical protein